MTSDTPNAEVGENSRSKDWPDSAELIGMSIALPRLGIEDAAAVLQRSGFTAVEVFLGQIGPAVVSVLPTEAHARATADHFRSLDLTVSTLNVVGDESFDPHGGRAAARRTSSALAAHMRIADGLGAQRILIWDGRIADDAKADDAVRSLLEVIFDAQEQSRLPAPPAVSVELHPYTFALKHGCTSALASALKESGAGFCLDFCHFGVASGPDPDQWLSADEWDVVNHIHYADTDCVTPDLHYPPGTGKVNIDRMAERMRGRGLAVAWDLFGWPAPRDATANYFGAYRAFVAKLQFGSNGT